VNVIWALADVAILTTFFRYGRSEFPGFISRPLFITSGIVIVITSFLIQWLFIAEFGTVGMKAGQYSAFLQNLLMSGLFIAMFVSRRGPRGQTRLIATAKWIGTLAPTILFGFIYGSLFIIGIGLLCSVFDLAYIGLLIWAKRRPSAFPTGGPLEADRLLYQDQMGSARGIKRNDQRLRELGARVPRGLHAGIFKRVAVLAQATQANVKAADNLLCPGHQDHLARAVGVRGQLASRP
jgi:hypothetical protein